MTPKLITDIKFSEYIYEEFLSREPHQESYRLCVQYLITTEPKFMIEYYPELYLQYIGTIKRSIK